MEGNIPAYYSEVSLRLLNVLEKVGLREEIRWKRINMMLQAEEIRSVFYQFRVHIFGSQAEATTTIGLQSDLDIVVCYPCLGVMQSRQSLEGSTLPYIMVSDANTPPGYVKLQRLDKDSLIPMFNVEDEGHLLDSFGRTVLCNSRFFFASGYERHGPADKKIIDRRLSVDFVTAMRVRSWPCQASQWENRINNYPSQATKALIKQTGALLVPVGNPLSPENHLEWRISVSYGEKILVWQFNSTQYKCYVLLKIIKKELVLPICGEKALSSYHCKTCVFCAIESTPSSLWQPENLLLCIELCLRTLSQWVKNGYCPNYFISGENMFIGKVYGHIQFQLLAVLHDLMRQEGKYLLRLSCDDIGQRLADLCQTSLIDSVNQGNNGAAVMGFAINILNSTIEGARKIFASQDLVNKIGFMKKKCCSHTTIPSVFRMHCSSSLGSDLASQCLAQEVIDQESLDIAHELLVLGCSSDVASGRLKLAAFYLMQDNFIMAENVLHQIQDKYTYLVTYFDTYPSEQTLCKILEDNLSSSEFMRQYVAFPVYYFQSEIHCMPKALILNMFQSKGSHIDVVSPSKCASVDPKFYLHYLEYQCYFRQDKTSHKMAALDNMLWVAFYNDLVYRDSALSLLACCLNQEGMYMDACKVLCISMKLKNECNAAMWQIAFLINDTCRMLRQTQ